MQRFKAPQALIDKVLAQLEADMTQFDVWPENHLSVTLFLLLQTQWDRNPMDNSMQNLKWASIESVIKRHPNAKILDEEQQDSLFFDITTMERHALSEINSIKAEQQQ